MCQELRHVSHLKWLTDRSAEVKIMCKKIVRTFVLGIFSALLLSVLPGSFIESNSVNAQQAEKKKQQAKEKEAERRKNQQHQQQEPVAKDW